MAIVQTKILLRLLLPPLFDDARSLKAVEMLLQKILPKSWNKHVETGSRPRPTKMKPTTLPLLKHFRSWNRKIGNEERQAGDPPKPTGSCGLRRTAWNLLERYLQNLHLHLRLQRLHGLHRIPYFLPARQALPILRVRAALLTTVALFRVSSWKTTPERDQDTNPVQRQSLLRPRFHQPYSHPLGHARSVHWRILKAIFAVGHAVLNVRCRTSKKLQMKLKLHSPCRLSSQTLIGPLQTQPTKNP